MAVADSIAIVRLGIDDVDLARTVFQVMVEVFEEGDGRLSADYVRRLLARDDLWAYGAVDRGSVVGGLTAHTLPMTRDESDEVFLYDLAVAPSHQRRGIGRLLVTTLVNDAARAGIDTVFVPADDEDTDALDFYRALGGVESPVSIFDLGAP